MLGHLGVYRLRDILQEGLRHSEPTLTIMEQQKLVGVPRARKGNS